MPWRMRNELMTLCAFIISCINSSSTFSRMYNVRVRSTMDISDSPHGVRSSRLICRKLEKKHSSYLLWHVTANAHCPIMQITDLYNYICLCMMSIYHCLDRIDAKSDNSQTRRLLVDAETGSIWRVREYEKHSPASQCVTIKNLNGMLCTLARLLIANMIISSFCMVFVRWFSPSFNVTILSDGVGWSCVNICSALCLRLHRIEQLTLHTNIILFEKF